jgi:hypothetical protein
MEPSRKPASCSTTSNGHALYSNQLSSSSSPSILFHLPVTDCPRAEKYGDDQCQSPPTLAESLLTTSQRRLARSYATAKPGMYTHGVLELALYGVFLC